ncbi:35117_t:CDS:2, partial [Gigaspora margarita]
AEICCLKQKGVSQVKSAKRFSVAKATISEALALWVSRASMALQTITGAIIQREATSVLLEDLFRFHAELQELIDKYNPKDIYNADKTALY